MYTPRKTFAIALLASMFTGGIVSLANMDADDTLTVPYCEYEDGSSQGGTCYRFDGGSNGEGVDYIIVNDQNFYPEGSGY